MFIRPSQKTVATTSTPRRDLGGLLAAPLIFSCLSCLFSIFCTGKSSVAQAEPSVKPTEKSTEKPAEKPQGISSRRVSLYQLESVTVTGTRRISAEMLEMEFGLRPGVTLNDELVMNTRSRLLSLGLFHSVLLRMKKGSAPGQAQLIVECEDDEQVLTDWALGGEMAVTFTETTARSASPDGPPRGYRLGLVGRNILNEQHRASALADLDARAIVREAEFAYGLPRFTTEDTQFDTRIHLVDVSHRYLNALGFGARGEAVWTQSYENLGDVQYGMAVYVNRQPRYSLPGAPTNVSGPKIGFHRESRLRKFVAGPGSLLEASLLLAPIQAEHSIAEIRLARSVDLFTWLSMTFDLNALSVGTTGSSVRGEARFDFPFSGGHTGIGREHNEQAETFVRFRGGFDKYEDTSLVGSAAIIGLRYHSSGFIAELALQITRVPAAFSERLKPGEVAP